MIKHAIYRKSVISIFYFRGFLSFKNFYLAVFSRTKYNVYSFVSKPGSGHIIISSLLVFFSLVKIEIGRKSESCFY